MPEQEQKPEEKIDLAIVLVAHLVLGAGIYVFGRTLKNKKEEIFGLIFAIAFVGLFIYSQSLSCQQIGENFVGKGCNIVELFYTMAILSWIYVIARSVQNRKRATLTLKGLGEAT